jgi:hypothetical protein
MMVDDDALLLITFRFRPSKKPNKLARKILRYTVGLEKCGRIAGREKDGQATRNLRSRKLWRLQGHNGWRQSGYIGDSMAIWTER